jgi:hypothetical protein
LKRYYKIRPNSGYLTWAKGEVITPKGLLKVAWKKTEDEKINIKIDAPKGLNERI